MEYTALYRQWRPQTFDEVVGQDHIVRILRNQIANNRVSHAYLFCGSRGTGKTSTAKIFARAVNCQAPVEGSPCGQCSACRSLSSENNMDILEIDAASNNKVEEMRELLDKVKYPPAVGRFKVYIIDEAHMLSIGAFNALLKTLEEPPEHVVFILATTEPHKVPATILSRCQRYDFKRISLKVMVDRLSKIGREMNVDIEHEAIETIARWAEGGMRDAISLLDQCIGFSSGSVTNKDVLAILGTADQEFIFDFVDNIMKGQVSSLLKQVDLFVEDGRDIQVFLRDLIYHLRNLMLVRACDEPSKLLDVSESTLERYIKQAQGANGSRLIRAIETLSALESELKWNSQPRVMLEMALIKISRPEQEDSLEALMDRISVLEKKIAQGITIPSSLSEQSSAQEPQKSEGISRIDYDQDVIPAEEAKANRKSNKSRAAEQLKEDNPEREVPTEKKEIKQVWPDILKTIKKERVAIYGLLRNVNLRDNGNGSVALVFPQQDNFYATAIEKETNRKYIEELIMRFTGQEVKVICRLEDDVTMTQLTEDLSYGKASDKGNNIEDPIVQKAIDLFGGEFVEVVEDE